MKLKIIDHRKFRERICGTSRWLQFKSLLIKRKVWYGNPQLEDAELKLGILPQPRIAKPSLWPQNQQV